MGQVTIDFDGLFLFESRADLKRVAVIDGGREGVSHGGKKLTKHHALFTATNVVDANWPASGEGYELKGRIQFHVQGQLSGHDQWRLPTVAQCGNTVPDGFFNGPEVDKKHAIIELRAGELCAWRRKDKNGNPGAVGTRVTLKDPASFTICGDDGRYLAFKAAKDCAILFKNTETGMTENDDDWLWYYVATDSSCVKVPESFDLTPACDPPKSISIAPLSLGCSNSQWP